MGAGTYLKERKPEVSLIAVEPAESAVISGGRPGYHQIQGIGAGFVPAILDTSIIDETVRVRASVFYESALIIAVAAIHNPILIWCHAVSCIRLGWRYTATAGLRPHPGPPVCGLCCRWLRSCRRNRC